MSSKLTDYFNKQPRLGTLSNSSKDGKVNSAYFGFRAGLGKVDLMWTPRGFPLPGLGGKPETR